MFSRRISGPIKPLFLKISDSFSAFQRCVWCLLGDFVSLHCPLNAETKHLINKVGKVVATLELAFQGLGTRYLRAGHVEADEANVLFDQYRCAPPI